MAFLLPIRPKNVKMYSLMKNAKKIALIIVLTVLLVCALTPTVASADSSSSNAQYKPAHGGYTLTTVVDNVDNPKPMGVRFSGFYFGGSGITVVVDIYSSDSFVIDFYINEQDSLLTASQLRQKQTLIALAEEINDFVNKVDTVANTQYDGLHFDVMSDIYEYNASPYGRVMEIDKYTYEMLQIAREMYVATDGAFNPAVYRLVDLWGFSSRIYSNGNFGLPYDREVTADEFRSNGYPLPDNKYVEAFSAPEFTDFSNDSVTLSQENGKYYVTKNVRPAVVDGVEFEQWLDLGGIAKGYATDGIREMLAKLGIDRFNVDAGSSSMAYGYNYDGGDNTLRLSDPFDKFSAIYAPSLVSLTFGKASISTSGQYIRKYTVNGVEYAHIIDGAVGAPAQTGIKLVTVVAPEGGQWAGKGDCLTTAITVMGVDKAVEFMNGYLKDNGINIVALYQSLDGKKQIISNLSQDDLTKLSDSYDTFAWAIEKDVNGDFVYNPNAVAANVEKNNLQWLLITLGVIACLALIGVIVYHIVKGGKKIEKNIINAKRDMPFKLGDIGVYLAVVLIIAVLFSVFVLGDNTEEMQIIKVVDLENNEILYVYNISQGKSVAYDSNSNGWIIEEVSNDSDGICVKFSREINGERHFNTMLITLDNEISVEMIDSICGYHQDCVRNFPAITAPNGSIVCSPNRLKIVTE